MPVIYATSVKNARMTIVRDAIDAGSGPGVLEIGTTGFASVLLQFTLQNPAGAVAGGVLALTPPALNATGLASSTAAEARIRDSNGMVHVRGLTVGTTGADVLLTSTMIALDEEVTLNSANLSHG